MLNKSFEVFFFYLTVLAQKQQKSRCYNLHFWSLKNASQVAPFHTTWIMLNNLIKMHLELLQKQWFKGASKGTGDLTVNKIANVVAKLYDIKITKVEAFVNMIWISYRICNFFKDFITEYFRYRRVNMIMYWNT